MEFSCFIYTYLHNNIIFYNVILLVHLKSIESRDVYEESNIQPGTVIAFRTACNAGIYVCKSYDVRRSFRRWILLL